MRVLLVHGMGRTPLSMWHLARRLRRAGFPAESVFYLAAVESFDRMVDRLRRRIEVLAHAGPYAAVGHSLGGLLLRAAAAGTRQPAHLFLLGTPNRSPRLARRLARWIPYRVLFGQAGQLLADPGFPDTLPAPACPCTVIAGTRGWSGRFSPFGDEPNDKIVALGETSLGGAAHVVTVRASHTFLMNHPDVARLVIERLRDVTT